MARTHIRNEQMVLEHGYSGSVPKKISRKSRWLTFRWENRLFSLMNVCFIFWTALRFAHEVLESREGEEDRLVAASAGLGGTPQPAAFEISNNFFGEETSQLKLPMTPWFQRASTLTYCLFWDASMLADALRFLKQK